MTKLINKHSAGLRKAEPTSVSQSSIINYGYAKLATDGNLKTFSQTNCGNSLIWFRMGFQRKYCFKSFKIFHSHVKHHELHSRERMAGAELFVIETDEGNNGELCDKIELSRVREKLPLILECPTVLCGNSVELRIEKENGCIHMREIESYKINCREKSVFRTKDGIYLCAGNV